MVQHLRPVVAVAFLWSAMAAAQSAGAAAPVAKAPAAQPSAAQAPVGPSQAAPAGTATSVVKAQAAPGAETGKGGAEASGASAAGATATAAPTSAPDAQDAEREAAAAAKAAAALFGAAPEKAKGASGEAPIPAWTPEGIEPDEIEGRGESMAGTLLRTVLVLGVVLAAIYLTLNVGLRKLMGLSAVGARGNQALVSVVERHAVGPRHSLLVVRAGTDYLVVGQTENGMNLLSKIEPSQVEAHALARAAAPEAAAGTSLSPFLQKLLARKGDTRQSPPPANPPPAA